MVESIYILIGYPQYEFVNKICYRKAYMTNSKSCKYQYRKRRKIKISKKGKNNEVKLGYWLYRGKTRKFIPLTKLHHRLKKLKHENGYI